MNKLGQTECCFQEIEVQPPGPMPWSHMQHSTLSIEKSDKQTFVDHAMDLLPDT